MKKLMMMAVLLAGAGAFADDQFLYWMVNPYDTEFHTAGRAFDYAYLTVTDQGGVKLTDGSGNAVHLESFVPDGDAMISLGTDLPGDWRTRRRRSDGADDAAGLLVAWRLCQHVVRVRGRGVSRRRPPLDERRLIL